MNSTPCYCEWYIIAYVLTFAIEQYRIVRKFPSKSITKWRLYFEESWFNFVYMGGIISFIIGEILRHLEDFQEKKNIQIDINQSRDYFHCTNETAGICYDGFNKTTSLYDLNSGTSTGRVTLIFLV